MVVKLKMVVMEKKQKGDGGEDGSFVVVVMEFIEGGEVVARVCCQSGRRGGCRRRGARPLAKEGGRPRVR